VGLNGKNGGFSMRQPVGIDRTNVQAHRAGASGSPFQTRSFTRSGASVCPATGTTYLMTSCEPAEYCLAKVRNQTYPTEVGVEA
jgi:hypothetical protein